MIVPAITERIEFPKFFPLGIFLYFTNSPRLIFILYNINTLFAKHSDHIFQSIFA